MFNAAQQLVFMYHNMEYYHPHHPSATYQLSQIVYSAVVRLETCQPHFYLTFLILISPFYCTFFYWCTSS